MEIIGWFGRDEKHVNNHYLEIWFLETYHLVMGKLRLKGDHHGNF